MFINIFSIVAFGCIVGSLLFCALYAISYFYLANTKVRKVIGTFTFNFSFISKKVSTD